MALQDKEVKKMNVVIAGRSFPVIANKEEELILPIIEKNLNEQIRQMQLSYSEKDIQDCLSMVLLTQAITAHSKEPIAQPDLSEEIDKLNLEIEAALV